jgi:hypothetical protein
VVVSVRSVSGGLAAETSERVQLLTLRLRQLDDPASSEERSLRGDTTDAENDTFSVRSSAEAAASAVGTRAAEFGVKSSHIMMDDGKIKRCQRKDAHQATQNSRK